MEYYPIIKKAKSNQFPVLPEQGLYKVASNKCELSLSKSLSDIFGQKIKTNQKVGYYFPDILIIDEDQKIYIDIEVDEPYSKSGIPTHFSGNKYDYQRDMYFNDNGWHVLRFSENQVLNQIINVVKTVKIFYNQILDVRNDNIEDHLSKFSEKRWTYDESKEFIRINKRDYYEYDALTIEEAKLSIITAFQTLDQMFDSIINKRFPEFDYENEMIFMPYFISDHYVNNRDSCKLIYLTCLPSDGIVKIKGKDSTFCHFSNYPKIEIYDSSSIEYFNFITDKKKENNKMHVVNDDHDNFYYYDFFLKGTMQDYFDSNLELFFKV
jgi:very-short-patch-repair endonuclease